MQTLGVGPFSASSAKTSQSRVRFFAVLAAVGTGLETAQQLIRRFTCASKSRNSDNP
jgi:hypothetical protein